MKIIKLKNKKRELIVRTDKRAALRNMEDELREIQNLIFGVLALLDAATYTSFTIKRYWVEHINETYV